jgi:hypothetical protein
VLSRVLSLALLQALSLALLQALSPVPSPALLQEETLVEQRVYYLHMIQVYSMLDPNSIQLLVHRPMMHHYTMLYMDVVYIHNSRFDKKLCPKLHRSILLDIWVHMTQYQHQLDLSLEGPLDLLLEILLGLKLDLSQEETQELQPGEKQVSMD